MSAKGQPKCRTQREEKKVYCESGKSEMSSETKASAKMKPKDVGKGKRYFARFAFQSRISNHKFEAHTKHSHGHNNAGVRLEGVKGSVAGGCHKW